MKSLMNVTKVFIALFAITIGILLLDSCKDDDNTDNNGSGTATVDLQTVAEGYTSPLGVVSPPGDNRLFVIDQVGKIFIIGTDGSKVETPFLDLTSSVVSLNSAYDERGLLGLAFHPDYKNNGKFYVYYQVAPRDGGPDESNKWNNLSRVSEFKLSGDANMADPASERIVLQWDDPQMNHNGGTIAFGNDGYLYIAIGDGGGADDVAPGHVPDWYNANAGGNGQDIEKNLLGSILRIDINTTAGELGYGIPADNPFVDKTGLDEIYAYGFRNPYRISFDMKGTNQLFAGDAGQSLYEEIDVVTKGGNYGWNVKEGTHCFNAADDKNTFPNCPALDVLGVPLTDPVIEINNASNPAGGSAATIIGGNIYRGSAIPDWDGVYVFGTFAQKGDSPNGELFMSRPGGNTWSYEEVNLKSFTNDLGYYLKGFGQDSDGEIYLTVSGVSGPTGATGKVLKLVKAQ